MPLDGEHAARRGRRRGGAASRQGEDRPGQGGRDAGETAAVMRWLMTTVARDMNKTFRVKLRLVLGYLRPKNDNRNNAIWKRSRVCLQISFKWQRRSRREWILSAWRTGASAYSHSRESPDNAKLVSKCLHFEPTYIWKGRAIRSHHNNLDSERSKAYQYHPPIPWRGWTLCT